MDSRKQFLLKFSGHMSFLDGRPGLVFCTGAGRTALGCSVALPRHRRRRLQGLHRRAQLFGTGILVGQQVHRSPDTGGEGKLAVYSY
jgi:hypothetical protein